MNLTPFFVPDRDFPLRNPTQRQARSEAKPSFHRIGGCKTRPTDSADASEFPGSVRRVLYPPLAGSRLPITESDITPSTK